MGIFGKSDSERTKDAENLKECIKNFSSEITKISFNDEANFDEVTYNKFSGAYNTAFEKYIKGDKSKAWFSHTNDVLKEISKKIENFKDKPILKQTYGDYCNCYNYDPDKRKKDAAIDQESIIGEYSRMVKQLEGKLKLIVKSRAYSDIKTSGEGFKDNSKQKALFEKFEKFDENLDKLELDGSYNQISKIFRDTFEHNIKGKDIDDKNKWFSHTNDVFKAINKKLKKFDKLGIDKKDYKDYLECFKYDQQKSSKKAAINDDRLFKSYQKLYEKILTKLKDYFKYNNLSQDEKLEKACGKYADILKNEKENIFSTLDIMERMEKCFMNFEAGKNICNLFSKVMLGTNEKGICFYDSRIKASEYLEEVKEPDDKNIKKVFKRVKVCTEKFIRNRVKAIEEKLGKELVLLNLELNNGNDFSNNFIFNYFEKNYEKYRKATVYSVIKTINATCIGNFTICEKRMFGGRWASNKYLEGTEQVYPKLEKINIKGGKLTKIGKEDFERPSNLTEINFNSEIGEGVKLEDIKTKFRKAEVNIGGIEIGQLIEGEKDFSDNLKKDIEIDNDFNLSNWLDGLKVRKSVLKDNLKGIEKLKFKPRNGKVTLGKEAFKIIDKFKDIEFTNLTEIKFDGKLLEIDKNAFSGKPTKLAKITFTEIDDSIEDNSKKLEEMHGIVDDAGVTIYTKSAQEI